MEPENLNHFKIPFETGLFDIFLAKFFFRLRIPKEKPIVLKIKQRFASGDLQIFFMSHLTLFSCFKQK